MGKAVDCLRGLLRTLPTLSVEGEPLPTPEIVQDPEADAEHLAVGPERLWLVVGEPALQPIARGSDGRVRLERNYAVDVLLVQAIGAEHEKIPDLIDRLEVLERALWGAMLLDEQNAPSSMRIMNVEYTTMCSPGLLEMGVYLGALVVTIRDLAE